MPNENLIKYADLATLEAFKENYDTEIGEKLNKKINIAQGAENFGKIFSIDETGNASLSNAPEAMGIVYDEAEKILEFTTKPQLPGNVGVDATLTLSGNAADSKVVGDRLAELEEKIESGAGSGGSGGDSGNGIANWSQNDETGEGYIQNRPFYMTREPSTTTEIVEVLPETEFALSSDGDYDGANTYGFNLEVGKTYNVTFNSVLYENITCAIFDGMAPALGSLAFSFTDYPFIIADYMGMFLVLAPEYAESTCTISISSSVTTTDLGEMKIEDKYAPHLQSDWDEADESSVNYMKNKPFGEKEVSSTVCDKSDVAFQLNPDMGVYMVSSPLSATALIEEGKTYNVIWDGVEYSGLVPHDITGSLGVGGNMDMSAANPEDVLDFSEYPFMIVTIDDDGTFLCAVITNSTESSHSLKVWTTNLEITKLQEKYQNAVDWNVMDESKGTCILNKPFGEFETGNITKIYEENITTLEEFNTGVYGVEGIVDFTLELGCKYQVIINGKTYDNLMCRQDTSNTSYVVIGDLFNEILAGSGQYGFAILSNNRVAARAFKSETGDPSPINLIINKYEVATKPIDEKYIPDTIARVEQLNSVNVDLSNYYNKTETYSKNEIDAKFDEYVDEIANLVGGDI